MTAMNAERIGVKQGLGPPNLVQSLELERPMLGYLVCHLPAAGCETIGLRIRFLSRIGGFN